MESMPRISFAHGSFERPPVRMTWIRAPSGLRAASSVRVRWMSSLARPMCPTTAPLCIAETVSVPMTRAGAASSMRGSFAVREARASSPSCSPAAMAPPM